MTPEQKKLARHALGLDNPGVKVSYRNRYFTSKTSTYPDIHSIWLDMVDKGWAGIRSNLKENPYTHFFLTLKGAKLALNKGESLDEKDF